MKLRIIKSACTIIRDLSRSERGTSVIELAIAAPVLMVFLLAIADFGRGLSEKYRLQQAVNRALEMAQTGRDTEYRSCGTKPLRLRGCRRKTSHQSSGSNAPIRPTRWIGRTNVQTANLLAS